MVNYVVKEKRQGNSRTILWIKTVDLPAKTGFSELFPELLKWDGKHPKQALYQTEPHPDNGILLTNGFYTKNVQMSMGIVGDTCILHKIQHRKTADHLVGGQPVKKYFLTGCRGQRSAKDKQRDPDVYIDTRAGRVAQ